MDAPVQRVRIRRRRSRRGSGGSKLLRSLLLSLGLCGLALSIVLLGFGVLLGNRGLIVLGAWYPPLSLLALLFRWVLLHVRQYRKRASRRQRDDRVLESPVTS